MVPIIQNEQFIMKRKRVTKDQTVLKEEIVEIVSSNDEKLLTLSNKSIFEDLDEKKEKWVIKFYNLFFFFFFFFLKFFFIIIIIFFF